MDFGIVPRPKPPDYDPRQPADFNPASVGRRLLRATRTGTLATINETQLLKTNDSKGFFPFVSLVTVATDIDGAPLLLVSGLSRHTHHLLEKPYASLLLVENGNGDPLAHPRLTLSVHAHEIKEEEKPRVRSRFLARHPKSQLYIDFPDFIFFRLEPIYIHINGGFGRAFEGESALVMSPLAKPNDFWELEQAALRHLATEHADFLSLYAEVFGKKKPNVREKSTNKPKTEKWCVTGLDPDGMDLAMREHTSRLDFPHRMTTPTDLQLVLKEFADKARDWLQKI